MTIFDWKYFSFVNLDWTWVQRELLVIPVLVLVLWFFWMRSVREALVDEQAQVLKESSKHFSDDEDEPALGNQVTKTLFDRFRGRLFW